VPVVSMIITMALATVSTFIWGRSRIARALVCTLLLAAAIDVVRCTSSSHNVSDCLWPQLPIIVVLMMSTSVIAVVMSDMKDVRWESTQRRTENWQDQP
jgi:hypothetical protein